MSELKPRDVPLWEKFARALGFDDDAIQRFEGRQMGEKTKAQEERELFRTHLSEGGGILDAPLPGANPEVPDLGTGMAGVVLAGGGQAFPPGIRPAPLTRPKAPASRKPVRDTASDLAIKKMSLESLQRLRRNMPEDTISRQQVDAEIALRMKE
jgi:hypothetical protein